MKTPILQFGQPSAPHLYRIGVEPKVVVLENDDVMWDETITHVEVHARTRWAAMALAEKEGYVVRDCNMIG